MEEVVQNNDRVRFERLKKWAKENFLAISGVLIMSGSLITSIVIAARGAVKAGAKGVSKFAKSLAELSKKLGPFVGTLFSLLANVVSLAPKRVSFVAKNLWLLALFLVYLAYQEFNNFRKRKKKN